MDWIPWFLFGLTSLALVVWVARLALVGLFDRFLPPIHAEMFRGASDGCPSLSVVVAAKDEVDTIEACLSSLCAQDYPNLQVIGVDDRSKDGTGEIMDRLATNDPRLSVLHVSDVREGWFGKSNAMREGVALSTGDWLLFTDADCAQVSPRSLAVAVSYARREGADFLSVLPSHTTHSFWERVIQPACSAILMLWFGPLAVNDPKRKTAYANGAFMLLRRSCYEAIGGHEAVRSKINEDMHLAKRAKEAGQRLLVVANRGLYTVRMYATFAEIWSGWKRIFAGCFASVRRLVAAALVLTVFSIGPWAALATSFAVGVLGWADSSGWWWLRTSSLAACVAQLVVMAIFYRLSRIPFLYGLCYPLGAAAALGILVDAIRYVGGRSSLTWRGTVYRAGAVVAQR